MRSSKALTYPGCKRIFGYNVLDHEVRLKIYDYIRKNPGVHYSDIANETNINRGTLRHHLMMLKKQNKVIPYKTRGMIHYFFKREHIRREGESSACRTEKRQP